MSVIYAEHSPVAMVAMLGYSGIESGVCNVVALDKGLNKVIQLVLRR